MGTRYQGEEERAAHKDSEGSGALRGVQRTGEDPRGPEAITGAGSFGTQALPDLRVGGFA